PDECDVAARTISILTVGPNSPGSGNTHVQDVINLGLVSGTSSHMSFAEFQAASLAQLELFDVIIAQEEGNLGADAEREKIRQYVSAGKGFLGETSDENVYPGVEVVPGLTEVVTTIAPSTPTELRRRLPPGFSVSDIAYPLFSIRTYDATN